MSGIHFHHHWLRHLAAGGDADHGPYNLETMAAREGRFAPATRHGPVHHAVHFDAAAYARLLRGYAEEKGVSRLEGRSEEHTSELQSLMRISYAVFCLKKKKTKLK